MSEYTEHPQEDEFGPQRDPGDEDAYEVNYTATYLREGSRGDPGLVGDVGPSGAGSV